MRWSMGVALVMLVGAGAAVTQAQKPQAPARPAAVAANAVKPIATVGEIMELMTIPLSNAVFEAGGEPPKDYKSWAEVRDKAIALAESGNLLMLGSRAKDRAAWMKFSRAQVDAAEAAAKAAAAKNGDQLSAASDALYETCAACHKVYLPN
jgi:cytochrome c556